MILKADKIAKYKHSVLGNLMTINLLQNFYGLSTFTLGKKNRSMFSSSDDKKAK